VILVSVVTFKLVWYPVVVMKRTEKTYLPYPTMRKATVDLLDHASSKHMIHGLI
jgi:hypothetical protein